MLLFLLLVAFLTACQDPVYTPKPRSYPRIEFPEKNYLSFDESYCNFTFQYPGYARVVQDTLFFDDKPVHNCWFDLYMEKLNARIHCTYSEINRDQSFDKLKGDAFQMAYKHQARADYIDEFVVDKPGNVKGIVFNIEGPAASPFQFYLSDEKNGFLRGALYFNTQTRTDSLAPMVEFVRQDIMEIINSFEWTAF